MTLLSYPTQTLISALDTLPLFIAIATYVVFWPGRFIGNGSPRLAIPATKESSSIDSATPEHKAEQTSE
jgi:hypothetical protein